MSEHERKNLTFNPAVLELADELMQLRKFSDLSGFLSQLVREEHERRQGPATFQDKPEGKHVDHPRPSTEPVSYTKDKAGAKGNRGTPRKPRGPQN